jgi:1-acyl-sn-glycerol-3-phosphate acyltransferase
MAPGRLIARLLTWAAVRLTVVGLENVPATGGVLLAINHSAFVDGPIVFGLVRRPTAFLIKIEMFRGPLGLLLRHIGQIPVRRGIAERAPLVAALDTLAEGGAIGIFPEGTRGVGDVSRVEHGIAFLALRSGCPVVPVACLGTASAFAGGWRPGRRRRIRVVFGEPFVIGSGQVGPARRTVAEAAEEIRIVLAKHVAQVAGGHDPEESHND